ncbi:uncharacterized protein LOC8267660 isoform X2 [Ricinus communis]|uniref:uncharacterized protein LOC8267660 isoform X2 n=1 Tax=Ricinus communis TaxID=3988 RepID=UPI00201A7CA3|nr:uncharacterized protein LOC8267660 isoform X2 [Ricinus communis]
MVESESKTGGGPVVLLSWADEVEQEEAQCQLQQKQKPNPFGSARPREVVLQEKGIDWRKLDLHLRQTSLLRQEPLNEKSWKENIPASSSAVAKRVHSVSSSNCLKQKQKDANLGFCLLSIPNQMPLISVPPLRYPPRNIVASLSESRNLHRLDNGHQFNQCRSNLKPEKKNTVYCNGIQEVQRFENLYCGSHVQFKHHDQCLHIEQGSQFKNNDGKSQPGQSVGKSRNMPKPASHIKGRYSDYNHPRRKLEKNGQNMVGSLLGKPPKQHTMRSPLCVTELKDVEDDSAARKELRSL